MDRVYSLVFFFRSQNLRKLSRHIPKSAFVSRITYEKKTLTISVPLIHSKPSADLQCEAWTRLRGGEGAGKGNSRDEGVEKGSIGDEGVGKGRSGDEVVENEESGDSHSPDEEI